MEHGREDHLGGPHGHRFYAESSVCETFNRICDAMYADRHKRAEYPGFYGENTGDEGLPLVEVDDQSIVIWQPGKVVLPTLE
jgi:hypothetical protein